MSNSRPKAEDLKHLMSLYRSIDDGSETCIFPPVDGVSPGNGAMPNPKPQQSPARPAGAAPSPPNSGAAKAPAEQQPSQLLFGRLLREKALEPGFVEPHLRPGYVRRAVDLLVIEQACDINPSRVRWLWPARIPLGRLTLIAGDPGIGKSLAVLDLAARVSRGAAWPDQSPATIPPSNVIVFSLEDDLYETVTPRLINAGADLTKTFVVEGVYNLANMHKAWRRPFRLPDDLPSLRATIKELAPKMVVFDPIVAYCGTGEGGEFRIHSILNPLAELAAECRVAIVCTTHLRRGAARNGAHRPVGSLTYTTASRAVWRVVRDAAEPARRIMLPMKLNLAPDKDGLAFRIEEKGVTWEANPLPLDADQAEEEAEKRSRLDEAIDFLRVTLADGSRFASEVIAEARACGISHGTLHRARKRIGARATRIKDGQDMKWIWGTPRAEAPQAGEA